MRFLFVVLNLFVVLAATEFKIELSATDNGRPVPKEELTLSRLDDVVGNSFGDGGNVLGRRKVAERNAVGPAATSTYVQPPPNPTAMSNNWCGSVNKRVNSTSRIKEIRGWFMHPNCRVRYDQELRQAAAPWIGISGKNGTILQAGTYCQCENWAGKVTNFAWLQWSPRGSWVLDAFPIKPGDSINVTMTLITEDSAKIIIENQSRGYVHIAQFTAGDPLFGVEAIWVVEAPNLGGYQALYPRFDGMWLQDAKATMENGTNLGILGATQWNVRHGCKAWEYDDTNVEIIQLWPSTGATS